MFGWFKKKAATTGPDFSDIDSQQKAEAAFRAGKLEKLYLMPLEFGGAPIPQNTLFVPIGVAAIKSNIDNNIIAALVKEEKISNYKAKPQYQGNSFIPNAIEIIASDPGEFKTTINIWGDAIASNN